MEQFIVEMLFYPNIGLAGFFPIHPTVYMRAWRNRKTLAETAVQAAQEASETS